MKPRELKCFEQVANVIGPELAEYELQRVIDSNCFSDGWPLGFSWLDTPQEQLFWSYINEGKNPYDHGHEKPELSGITTTNSDKQRSDGSTASYYELPKGATELQHLISHRNMNAQIGEIFRACYRYGLVSHSDMLRDAKKIKFYAQAEIDRLEKLATELEENANQGD